MMAFFDNGYEPWTVDKYQVRDVMEQVDALNLPDGAHWQLIHDRLGLEYGDVFDYIYGDPDFFGYEFIGEKS